jgi:hypothetical protein
MNGFSDCKLMSFYTSLCTASGKVKNQYMYHLYEHRVGRTAYLDGPQYLREVVLQVGEVLSPW